MDFQALTSIGLALGGVGMLAGPWLYDQAKALLAKVTPQGHVAKDPLVQSVDQLASLVLLRKHLANNPEAVKCIDTILAPAVMASSGEDRPDA
jgi:hypothetical protein